MEVDERAQAGLFLAMQYPVEVPGVSMSNFLRSAKTALDGEAPAIRTWTKDVREAMDNLDMDTTFATRTSTKDSPVVKRNAPKSCNWNCSNQNSPSLTKPTPASTLTPCALCPKVSTAPKKITTLATC